MEPDLENSEIVDFYRGSTIFLTGGTGFLGKLFIEKLLRTCPDLKCIYLLVRTKKGKDVKTRFEEIFSTPNFDPLYRLYPNFISKLHLIPGDCVLPNLGLSEEHKQKLMSEVNIVIHCAATVRFDQILRTAAYINVRSVQDLINMCKEMKNLKSALYISTAFSNCVRSDIDEKFYEPPLTSKRLFSLIEALDDEQLDKITPVVLKSYPNTYAFTKAIAEDLINSEAKSLPIAVYRPSIITATAKEPITGWIDNFYGATGVMMGAALGLLHVIYGNKKNIAEIVPADYVINGALATLWEIGSSEKKELEDVPVYNYVSCAESPIRWDRFNELTFYHGKPIYSTKMVWSYSFKMQPNRLLYLIEVFLYHTIPGYIVDFVYKCIGKEAMLVDAYQKIEKFSAVISYFTVREWNFSNDNTQKLWRRMSLRDQELFEFSMKSFDWDEYIMTYIKGARVYLLEDPMETVPIGRAKGRKFLIAHYAILTLVGLLLLFFVRILLSLLFGD